MNAKMAPVHLAHTCPHESFVFWVCFLVMQPLNRHRMVTPAGPVHMHLLCPSDFTFWWCHRVLITFTWLVENFTCVKTQWIQFGAFLGGRWAKCFSRYGNIPCNTAYGHSAKVEVRQLFYNRAAICPSFWRLGSRF